MQAISVRTAHANDAALIAQMSRKTFYDAFAKDNSAADMEKFMSEQFTEEALMAEVGATGNIFLLAYSGGEPAGYVRMRHATDAALGTDNALEIARIYAINSFVGKGVGSALMQVCVDTAVSLHKAVLWLGVWEHNKSAIAFYTKWGFEKFGEHDFLLGNDLQTDWLMKRVLV